jgi:hypothetical protein
MVTESTSMSQASPRSVPEGYEPRDANVRWIFGIVAGMICCGIAIQIVLNGMLKHLLRGAAPTDSWNPIRALQPAKQPPPFPRLQISSRLELQQFRAREDQELTNYGWINRTTGIVRIPIERAMNLVLQKGLPTRTNLSSGEGPSAAQLVEQRSSQRKPEQQDPK